LYRALVLGALAVGFCACGGASTQQGPRDARAAGGLPAWHPVTLTQMAYGKGGSAARVALPQESLVARAAEPRRSFADKASAHSRPSRHAKASTPSYVAPAPQTVVATRSPAADAQTAPPALAQISTEDVHKYSMREASSAKQQQYRGGDVVVITASTLVIVLLIVLLVVLLIR
jgi:hypothetical protein